MFFSLLVWTYEFSRRKIIYIVYIVYIITLKVSFQKNPNSSLEMIVSRMLSKARTDA